MTTVINLFAGPGSGKSTLAAEIFYKLKRMDKQCEIVREYVKEWAWAGREITDFDQFFITAKQAQIENNYYNKVDYLISDSPMLLGCFYEKMNHGDSIALPSALRLVNRAEKLGVVYKNYLLTRKKPYNSQGRYETEDRAKELDKELERYLRELGICYKIMDMLDSLRADNILVDCVQ